MSDREWAIVVLIIGAVIAGVVNTVFRRAERTGRRIGRLEKWVDHESGRQAGMREARRRGSDGT